MASIRLATASNVRGFQALTNALATRDGKWADSIDYDGLQDEIGRFRVWSGNLGALQKGHSSLDYRLRDSPLLSSNALKFLKELEDNINEAVAVVSETRLPYELQPKPEKSEDDDDDEDDSFFDEDDEDDDEEGGSRTELSMRFAEIVDIIDNLYKLSVRIRTPTIRSRSLKAATYKPKDPETGVDILSAYASHDLEHVQELLSHLRQPHEEDPQSPDYEYLTIRLSAAITLRRRQFKYWKRHRDKLGMSTIEEEQTRPEQPAIERPTMHQRNDTLEVLLDIPAIVTHQEAHSQRTGKTLLSGTEATHHHQSLDEIVDTKSVTSYAVTVKDLHGKGVELPPPPRAADGDKDFECPYCYIICPARYGRGRAWRTHLLQDLQPYVCTYSECESSEQLFRSRREWAEHEASHRKAWRCPEHPAAVYKTSSGLEEHFHREHADSFPESQLASIVKVGETTTIDVRLKCPICNAVADTEGLGDFHNHIANHLERIATFALPTSTEDESDGASGVASRGRSESSESRNMSDFSLPSGSVAKSETFADSELSESDRPAPVDSDISGDLGETSRSKAMLSAESLHQLPDARQNRLDALLTDHGDVQDDAADAHDVDTDSENSLYSVKYSIEEHGHNRANPINVSNIPTVRSLYRTKRLLQRDQSYAPNDSYNQVISFCYHDLTKLEVDAIVNSANKAMRDTGGKTLNNIIHQAAGPNLGKETKALGKMQDQAVLTGGYNLAAKHIIHVLRPGYYNSTGMTEFNQLIDCYRNALNKAADHSLKTVAFPCLGTGGVGFPPRVAARITLQEVREYLDADQDYKFERIIFCVNTAADEKAYMDFLPVYFPPTHDDVETARSSIWSEDRAELAAQVLETRNTIQKVFSELSTGLSLSVQNFPEDVLLNLDVIDSVLGSIRRFLLWSNEIQNGVRDLKLICKVVQLFSGNITETISLAKDQASLGQRSDTSIWDDFVSDMEKRHGTNPSAFLKMCSDFVNGLDSMVTNGVDLDEVIELVDIRKQIERYKVRQRGGGGDAESTQQHLDEVLYVREFQRQTVAQSKETVKLHRIQSVSQLYKLGDLEEKATLAHPSALFNDNIYLVREDITKLEVDVMVNSTDMNFAGMGTLDRSVFLKGGDELRSAVLSFGTCKIGDVRLTEGYNLPAKHVLHVVPPEQYRKDTKDVLRKIYREVLHTAVAMRATSVALPSIGTGMLNYPRRDCVSLALEETKRFLESAVPDSMLEKIVFVVFSSNDEFVYKSLLPVYFPPVDMNVNRALPASVTRQGTGASTASITSAAPRRTLFGSIGEAFRSVRSGKAPETSRPITANEEHALISFESHAKDCETCHDVDRLYIEGRDLCEHGYSAAQVILWHMDMQSDQNVYTKPDAGGESMRLEFPTDMFPISTKLLATVEKSNRDGGRTRPFVTTNRPYGAIVRDQRPDDVPSQSISDDPKMETPSELEPKKARAHALMRYSPTDEWYAMANGECQIRVYPNIVEIIKYSGVDTEEAEALLMALKLEHSTVVQRHITTPDVVLTGATQLHVPQMTGTEILFRCPSDGECNSLLRIIRRAIEGLQAASSTEDQHTQSTSPAEPEKGSSSDYIQWNKRLRDVRAELAQSRRATGGLSDLQYKMDRLSAVASELQKRQQSSGTSKLFDPSRSPLATRVLVCLTADLKSRPGSYIGMKTDNIVAELRTTPGEALSALTELMAEGEVHNTVDDDTWIVSHPPDDLPVLSQEQAESDVLGPSPNKEEESHDAQEQMVTDLLGPSSDEEEDLLGSDKFPILVRHDDKDPPAEAIDVSSANPKSDETAAEQSKQTNSRGDGLPLDPATKKVYAYLMDYNYALPSDGAHHILDIAAAVYLTRDEVGQALSELEKLGLAHVSGKDGWWWASKADKGEDKQPVAPESAIRDAPSLADTPSGANFAATTDTPSLHDYLNPTTEQIYTYLLTHPYSPPDGEHHIRDIAAALSLPRDDVKEALHELKHLGLAHRNKQKGWWRAIKIKQRDAATSTIRNAPTFKETSPGPTLAVAYTQPTSVNAPEAATEKFQLETIILDGRFGYVSPTASEEIHALVPSSRSNMTDQEADRQDDALIAEAESQARWTRIHKRIVDPQVLAAAGEAFDDVDDALVVHRVVRRRVIMRWAEESVEIREQRALREGGKEKQQEAMIRDPPSFADTPPSPTLSPSIPISRLSLDTLNIDDFFSYASTSGVRWTRIDKRLVDPRVLVAEDEDFEDKGDELIVHRILRRGEIARWAEESVLVREGKGKGKARETKQEAELVQDRERFRNRGKDNERNERDEYQERLDRVIAGDMKEEEMRHFRDEKDNERYI